MNICIRGKTRVVLLVGENAIKISRLRILRLLGRMLTFPFTSKANHARFYARYGRPLWRGMVNYLIAGLYANRNEFEHYQMHADPRVVPTTRMLLRGWIIVQPRGEPVSPEQLASNDPFRGEVAQREFLERDQPWQFCRVKGRVLLADYGRHETRRALCQKFEEVISSPAERSP